jgi:hypothetical protein
MDRIGSRSCPTAGIAVAETSDSSTRKFVGRWVVRMDREWIWFKIMSKVAFVIMGIHFRDISSREQPPPPKKKKGVLSRHVT